MVDGSPVTPNASDYDTQYAQQLSDLIPQLQQTMNGPELQKDQEPAQIPDSAIERASSADYGRIVGKIAQGIQAKRGTSQSLLNEYGPQLLASAYMADYSDPELAQSMRDIAGGLSTRGIKNLREYIDSKITDAPTSKQFKDEFDKAAAEAQKSPSSQAAQPAMRKLLDHLVKFAQEKASSGGLEQVIAGNERWTSRHCNVRARGVSSSPMKPPQQPSTKQSQSSREKNYEKALRNLLDIAIQHANQLSKPPN
jgi:hypothetical protein